MTRNLRVALIEDEVAWGDKYANLEQLGKNIRNVSEGTDELDGSFGDSTSSSPYLAGKSTKNGDEVVFVGGRNLDDVKHYAKTIKFK